MYVLALVTNAITIITNLTLNAPIPLLIIVLFTYKMQIQSLLRVGEQMKHTEDGPYCPITILCVPQVQPAQNSDFSLHSLLPI